MAHPTKAPSRWATALASASGLCDAGVSLAVFPAAPPDGVGVGCRGGGTDSRLGLLAVRDGFLLRSARSLLRSLLRSRPDRRFGLLRFGLLRFGLLRFGLLPSPYFGVPRFGLQGLLSLSCDASNATDAASFERMDMERCMATEVGDAEDAATGLGASAIQESQ